MTELLRLEELRFDNSYARLPGELFARVRPTPLARPWLVSFNPDAAELIDLDPAEAERPDFADFFGGGKLLPGADPLAALYAGHQFGSWVPQLGDGRAILLGEAVNGRGERWDLQLKGSGPTPFSRGFDGRSVLRSAIREYLGSEAVHGLGIPTTRALCVVGSEEPVQRETVEAAAALLRMAPTHVRFGTFEVLAFRGWHEALRTLADHVVRHHFPQIEGEEDRFPRLLREVVERTARLMAMWQAVGFAHGVMNTDNMSVLGLTIDYGPFGFLDDHDPRFLPNHSDPGGRYAFDQQPAVGLWNCARLAGALLPLMTHDEAVAALDAYEGAYAEEHARRVRAKLGLARDREDDGELWNDLSALLAANSVDHTGFFRALGGFRTGEGEDDAPLRDRFPDAAGWEAWAARYRGRLRAEGSGDAERRARMDRVNPKYVLRNYLAQAAIEAAEERRDPSEIEALLRVLRDPFAEHPGMERLAGPPPEWGRRLVVSCSS